MVWVYRILVALLLASGVGCMLGALVLLIEDAHNTRRRHKRIMEAIEQIQKGGNGHVDSQAENKD